MKITVETSNAKIVMDPTDEALDKAAKKLGWTSTIADADREFKLAEAKANALNPENTSGQRLQFANAYKALQETPPTIPNPLSAEDFMVKHVGDQFRSFLKDEQAALDAAQVEADRVSAEQEAEANAALQITMTPKA